MNWQNIFERIQRHTIIYGVIAALLIAILMTMVSMALYVSSGASRLDLSRPGYENIRAEVQSGREDNTFRANGPLNEAVYDDFQDRFTKRREVMQQLGDYRSTALNDRELQIAPSE